MPAARVSGLAKVEAASILEILGDVTAAIEGRARTPRAAAACIDAVLVLIGVGGG